jgi:hypothetical protein
MKIAIRGIDLEKIIDLKDHIDTGQKKKSFLLFISASCFGALILLVSCYFYFKPEDEESDDSSL